MAELALDAALLRKLDALRLTVRWMRWGSRMGGRFVINRRGSSIEFADYTPYSPGDDIRAIDWNLYARLDKLFVKTHKEEVELAVELIVDATTSMGLPSPRKFERASQLALALAYIGVSGRHLVRQSWVQPGRVHCTPWFSRRPDLTQLTALAGHVQPDGAITLAQWMPHALATMRMRGGQAIVISDWMMRPADAFAALHGLLRRHVEVKLIQVLTAEELDPVRLARAGVVVDSETGQSHELAYRPEELAQAVLEHNETLARFCKRNGILFAQHRVDEPLAEFLLTTLPRRGFIEPVR